MSRRSWPGAALALAAILACLVILAAFPAPPPPPARAAAPDPAPVLRLRAGEFDPLTLQASAPGAPGQGDRLLVVQFDHPPTPADRARLVATGVEVGDTLPDFAYLVRVAPDQADALAALSGVRWVGAYRPEWRIDPALTRRTAPSAVLVETWPGRSADVAKAGAPSGKARLRAVSRSLLTATADRATVQALADLPDVVWVGPVSQRRTYNDVARSDRIMRIEGGAWARGLFGAGQIVAVADSGLDVGDLGRLSPDFAGRVAATLPLTGTTWNDAVGHGTHVAGSILGNGRLSGSDPAQHRYTGSLAGMAPEARLVVQAFQVDASSGEISGLPDDLEQLFAPAYARGARVHSDSWGGPSDDDANPFGVYDASARAIDRFTWSHPDFLPVFAAGNDGTDGNLLDGDLGDGVVDPDSLSTAATAKNALVVGASEGLRASGGYADVQWLLFSLSGLLGGGGNSFLQEPIASDTVSNNPEGIAAFSSRGPTDDGRIKPDLVAPGTNIVSTRSLDPAFDPAALSWGVYDANDKYVYNGGTSMATPLAAGAAALVREVYQRAGMPNPSAALVKATLIHHARDLAPGQYGSGAKQELQARPNIAEGWGRIDLGDLVPTSPTLRWTDDHAAGVQTGQDVVYTAADHRLTVTDRATPLRVTLAWTDYPAAAAAARQLVNDLDVDVISPSGVVYPMALDRLNNVEMVEVAQPELGPWRVVVHGYNVPQGPQPYALVVSGGLGAPLATPTPVPSPTPDNIVRPYRVYLPLAAQSRLR